MSMSSLHVLLTSSEYEGHLLRDYISKKGWELENRHWPNYYWLSGENSFVLPSGRIALYRVHNAQKDQKFMKQCDGCLRRLWKMFLLEMFLFWII
jgi:hypothetical protein